MTATEADNPLVELDHLSKEFGRRAGWFRSGDSRVLAVDDVSLTIFRGESFGLVGETGCGKTTLGRLVLRFEQPTSGTVRFDNADVTSLHGDQLKTFRRQCQLIFQNPYSSLNPRRSVRDTLSDGYEVHDIASGTERDQRMTELLGHVGLNPNILDRYPHQLSGGQRQRIVIARALSVGPRLVVADEPVSALDVSVQAQVLNLLKSLQEEFALTYLLITHDLRVVNFFSTRIGVMYLGRLVEVGPRGVVVTRPVHPYTRALISAAPSGDPAQRREKPMVEGDIEQSSQRIDACVFSSRCWLKRALGNPKRCDTERPPLREVGPGSWAACHYAEDSSAASGTEASATV
jgi:oligopeptide/dipeptide ABC transporter ATP-binding protein